MPKPNYKKAYTQAETTIKELSIMVDSLESRHKNLNLEFDKAVEINKKFQHTIIEQRGVINYLEGKKNGN